MAHLFNGNGSKNSNYLDAEINEIIKMTKKTNLEPKIA